MFVFICFSLPQSITICIHLCHVYLQLHFDAFEEPVVLAARARQWPWWRGARRSSRPGTRQGVYGLALLEVLAIEQWCNTAARWRNTHWQSLSLFACFFLLGGKLAFAKTKLFGMLESCRVAVMQTSKASEASSNHVLFTKQKGVRQIHSSCQKKTWYCDALLCQHALPSVPWYEYWNVYISVRIHQQNSPDMSKGKLRSMGFLRALAVFAVSIVQGKQSRLRMFQVSRPAQFLAKTH